MLLATAAQAGTLNVRLVLSDSSPPYRQFATSFIQALAVTKADVVVTESQDVSGANIDLIVTVGMKAAELARTQVSAPVLAAMVAKRSYDDMLAQSSPAKSAQAISAIYLDQPWDRQLDFWQATLPKRHRIGLLYSPNTRIDIARLRQDIAKRGGTLAAQAVRSSESLFSSLADVLNGSDVLIATPDSAIYSNSNIRNILLTSYRRGIPLIGLSQPYVNAGALCAIFSTPEQLAVQASATVSLFARTRRLPDAQYPTAFTIASNQQVGRSLGIVVPSQDAIRSQMSRMPASRMPASRMPEEK